MTLPHGGPDEIYRDLEAPGDPGQGNHNPQKSQVRALWGWLLERLRDHAGGNLVLGNRDPSPGAVGQVHIEVDQSLSLPDDNTYAGVMVRNRAELPGADNYKFVAGTYLDRLKLMNPANATWTDAATLFIAGPPQDPADQNGSTSFALFINEGFNRIRDRLVVGNFDHSMDVLTANGGTGSHYTLTVRNEGVDQPRMFRVLEPTFEGGACQEGYPMINCVDWTLGGSYFQVQTGGRVTFGDYGSSKRSDAETGFTTVNMLGVDANGIMTAVPLNKDRAYNKGPNALNGDVIDVSQPRSYVLLNSAAESPSYTLPNGYDGQELNLIGAQASLTAEHQVNGGFLFDRGALPGDLSPDSITVKNGEHVKLIFLLSSLRWVVLR
ncbi:MAG: hypothetical protein JXQ89_17395 [Pelagimonas sp.]